ncbi:hypothetical protein M438DRAFT_355974 [Aureobasidium pullulans EXF-150]|uniref:F-box domain-containing protein n=1 Tax=Aureobasidium pullulans EXF-150 TaxID=1043002 RepID=A0A074XFL6_AURPU|nr:uncharacterized protein M438DRAFT_355974 [Aureobasidium pullulans EXF-150]KEQ84178.1 hypothetical protein M438DRAFT_355974 [Aureobasidium pullulans EXF-150]
MSASKCRITLLDMPDEMLTQIAYTVEPEALALLRLTCKAHPYPARMERSRLPWRAIPIHDQTLSPASPRSELETLEIRNLMCDHSDSISPPIIAYSGRTWCDDVEEVRAGFDGLIAQIHTRRERLLMGEEEDGDYSGPGWSDEDDGFEESDYELERENGSEDESDSESTDQDDEAIWDM